MSTQPSLSVQVNFAAADDDAGAADDDAAAEDGAADELLGAGAVVGDAQAARAISKTRLNATISKIFRAFIFLAPP